MISSTFFQELFTGNIRGDFPFGRGDAKQGGQASSDFSTIFNRLMNDTKDSSDAAAFTKTLPRGHQFLEQLKKAIMASGVSLEANQVGADALAEFRNLLVKAGFNRQEVQEMMSDLTSGDTGKGVTLAVLFAKASQLSKPDQRGDAPVLLDISALPYIETILGQLGMGAAQIRSVLADAKVEGSGIDLGKLAANIRRAMTADNRLTETASDNPNDVLDMMQHIGLLENKTQPLTTSLDKMISELSRLIRKNATSSEEDGAADEVSGDLLVPYLQQIAAPLGGDGKKLLQLIGSAGKDNAGFDGEALLARLVRMRQELSTEPAASGMASSSGAAGETRKQGEMSLSRFVSALEDRISAGRHMDGVLERGRSGQPTARIVSRFLEKISSDSAGAQDKSAVLAGVEQQHDKQGLMQDVRQAVDKSVAGTNGKDALGQNTLEATRPGSLGGDTGRNTSENSSGKEETARFIDVLTASGKQKITKTLEQNLSAADGFMRAAKSASEIPASVKMPANRTLPGYLLDQVSRQIVKLRAAGENEITLQLKPPHLGRMQLNIEHTSGGIKVGIVVESAAAKEMLLSHTSELKTALGDQGLRLDKIDVEARGDFGRSMAQAGREFGQSSGQSGRRTGHGPAGGGFIPEGLALPETVREMDAGRLNLVA